MRLSSLTVGMSALVLWIAHAPLDLQAAQSGDGSRSREQAALVEEQELLARKLARIAVSMGRLADRFDAEGRVHAAKLLREAIEHIALRREDAEGATLEELMTGSQVELDAGQSMQSIESQQRVVEDLERLLAILMDRPDLDELEDELEKLKRQKAELGAMARAEKELREKTEALREDASNETQKSLEAGIQAALAEQRRLLAENEKEARSSGALDLEKLEAALEALLEDQHIDAEVLQSWDPTAAGPLEELLPMLEAARAKQARAQRLTTSAEELRSAAKGTTDEAEGVDPQQSLRELQEAAEAARRAARASGDEGAERAAKALEDGAERLRAAGEDEAERARAASELDQLARELEQRAQAERADAGREREAARKGLAEAAQAGAESTQELAQELDEILQAAQEEAADAAEASEEAHRRLRNALSEMRFLGQALGASQAQNAERAERIEAGVERLPQDLGEDSERAQDALKSAAEAMKEASTAANEGEPQAASEAAQRAEKALQEAQAALSGARKSQSQGQPSTAALAESQEALADEVRDLAETTDEASMDEEARQKTEEALEQAAQAMQQAAEKLSEGKSGSAAEAQRQAQQALDSAAEAAREGVEPQSEEDRERAEELAKEQERIEKELYEFMERFEAESDEETPPLRSMSEAQSSASEARQSLEKGDLDKAAGEEQETERAIEEAMDDLTDEEEQYQELRDEELLFQIAEEVAAILEAHEASAEEVREVDAGRKPNASASRGQKLRLRKIARNQIALAERGTEIGEAIREEGSVVFGELIARVEHDLRLVARDLGEAGGYQSGERVQALQDDVSTSLGWLGDALEEEMERHEESPPPPPGGEPPPPGENRLVPDVAELRLLSRMELDVLDNIDELLVLYPELRTPENLDPLLLEDIQRLAHRHERATELFQQFRERLGIPPPGAEMSVNRENPHTGGEAKETPKTEEQP